MRGAQPDPWRRGSGADGSDLEGPASVGAQHSPADELLSTYAEQWTIDRFPAVDLAVLRIGVFELLWCDDVPDGVAVSEAVELAATLSTDDSPAFVNGLLGRLLQLKPALGG